MPLPLLPLALSLAPELVRLLAGDRAGGLAAEVAGAVAAVAGTEDAGAARLALADPARAAALRERLASIALEQEKLRLAAEETLRRQELEEFSARLADTGAARGAMLGLAREGSALAWGPALVSTLVVGGFFLVLLALIWAPEGARLDPQIGSIVNVTVGALGAAFAAVVNFWIGSSQGSRDKDGLLRAMQASQAGQVSQALVSLDAARRVPERPASPDPEARFARCLTFVLRHEGGFVDHPRDPGGATNFGITLATLAAHREAAVTAEEVRALTREEAAEIYRARFWTPLRGAELPPGLDLMVFDFGVNAGPGRSARLLQRAAGVTADGSIGPITLGAVRAAQPEVLIAALAEARGAHYRALPHADAFGRGWARRTEEARVAALAMSAEHRRAA